LPAITTATDFRLSCYFMECRNFIAIVIVIMYYGKKEQNIKKVKYKAQPI